MRELVRSLFGDVENVDAVARWVRDISSGRPRAALEAANHLVDSRIIRFEDGLWVLPQRLPGTGLPASVDQALDATIAALDRDARELCRALALSSEQDPLLVAEYGGLVPGVAGPCLNAALRELVARSIVVPTPQSYAFAHPGLREAARRSIPRKHLPDLHRRIAAAYASAEDPSFALSAHHLLAAGDLELAFEQATLAMERRWLPPTVNLDSPDDDCDLDYIPREGRAAGVEYALSNSFGFGGINAALVFRRAD